MKYFKIVKIPSLFKNYHSIKGIFIVFLLFCTAIYTVQLDSIPFSVHNDEAATSKQAIKILSQNLGIFDIGWFDESIISYFPHTFFIWLLGNDLIGNRLGSVIFGLLTLPIFYLLVKLLFTNRIAWVATILLGTSHLWIALNRIGIIYVQATFLFVASLYFTLIGLHKKHILSIILGGIFLGFCFYSYFAARIAPFVIIPYFLLFILINNQGIFSFRGLKKNILLFAVFLFSAGLIFLPLWLSFVQKSGAFSSRTNEVFVFSETNREWIGNKSFLNIISSQTKQTLNIFAGDNSPQYGYGGQLIDYVTLLLFIAGILYSFRIPSLKFILIALWFIFALLGQILTIAPTPIFLPRFVVGLPVFFIFCALGLECFIETFNKYKFVPITILFLLSYVILFNLHTYFIEYPKSFYQNLYIQRFINENQDIFSRIRDNISDIIKRIGMNGIINLVHETFKRNDISLNQCHILLHLIGHEAYEVYNGNINQMVGNFGTICWEAYQHGVEASIALNDPNPIIDLELLCKKWRQVYPEAGCYHGVGHAFLEASPKDIKNALNKCDSLIPTYDDSIPNCYRGAFSEFGNRVLNYDGNTGNHYDGVSTVEFKYQYPLIFCQELEERYKESCYSQLAKIVYQSEIGTAIQDCNIEQYNDKTKLICIRTLGLLYAEGNLTENNTIQAPLELNNLSDEQRQIFISGIMAVFNLYAKEAKQKDSNSFCDSLQKDKDKTFCKTFYKES